MQTGAVIVAAGACSRMGNFKPMMNVGSISISQRLVATLQQAGVSRIVMVTGYQAEELEHHLAGSSVIFLRNEEYLTTQMFVSAKIGLSYIRGKCDRVFFMPVDVPLFTAKTMEHLLKSGAELACPVCDGMRGHPIMLSDKVIDRILSESGDCGLQGALSRCGIPEQLVAVADEGILLDVDTPADYHSLVKLHNDQMIRPVVHITLAKQKGVTADTNTLIDISARDPYMRKLAADINVQLRLLRQQRHKYLTGDRELKEAVTNISHDLRTPLTAIWVIWICWKGKKKVKIPHGTYL